MTSPTASATVCDANSNGIVDSADIYNIQFFSNGQATSGSNDPRDGDGNGIINKNDVRVCILKCTPLAGCQGLENRRPRALNDSASTTVNQPVTIDLVANDRDVDGRLAISKLRIVAKPRRGRVINHRNGTVTYRPNRGFLGNDNFRYEIQDNQGAVSNVARVRVNISNTPPPSGNNPITGGNLPPVANAGTDISAATNTPVTLDGSQSSDPERGQLSFSWQFLTVPTGSTATIANSQSPTPNFTPNVDGGYELVLTVSDGVNASSDNVSVNATTANRPPFVNAGADKNVLVLPVTPVTLTCSVPNPSSCVNDPDNSPISPLTLRWFIKAVPAGSAFTVNTTLSTTETASFTPDVVGAYTLTFEANDGSDTTADDVVVNAANNVPPNADAGADRFKARIS